MLLKQPFGGDLSSIREPRVEYGRLHGWHCEAHAVSFTEEIAMAIPFLWAEVIVEGVIANATKMIVLLPTGYKRMQQGITLLVSSHVDIESVDGAIPVRGELAGIDALVVASALEIC